jgi:hypothetical protein
MISRVLALCLFALTCGAICGCSQSNAQSSKDKECSVEIEPVGSENECPSGKIRFHFQLSGCGGSKGTFDYTYTTKDGKGSHGPFKKSAAWTRPREKTWEQTEFPSLACDEVFDAIDVDDSATKCTCMGE